MRSRRFEIQWESRYGAWADDLRAILSSVPRTEGTPPPGARRNTGLLRGVASFLISLVLHGAALAYLPQMRGTPRVEPVVAAQSADVEPLYIDLRTLKDLKILVALPVVTPSGPGGTPGGSSRIPELTQPVLQAATATHPSLAIIVNPLKPENTRQAIHQTVAPPDLRIKVEQQVPDIVLLDESVPQKPQVDMTLQRPLAPANVAGTQAAPAPTIDAKVPELAMKITSSVQEPRMPVSYFAPDSLHTPREPASGPGHSDAQNPSPDPSSGVIVMSVDPATFSQLATLAQGNRYSALAIAPSKEGPGSPGGESTATLVPGTNGTGAGGDPSVGVGGGKSGGGGGATQMAENARFSAVGGSGTSGGVDANRLLSPVLPAAIYPVNIAPKLRRAPLVISAGPMGGGGLDVYGALNCGKVYSIFLPMPGKNWVLQYCAHEPAPAPATQPEPPANTGAIRMQPGLVPPSPEQQFDFRRLPVPDKDGDKLIIVQATIEKTGAVSNARVFQGVLPAMDIAAVQALAKWKFDPATRGGAAIEVDALVGIPVRLPQEATNTSPGTLKIQAN